MRVTIQSKTGVKEIDLNRRKAIRERCLNCAAWLYAAVANCEFTDCNLYSFRSGHGKQDSKARSKSIRQYCLWCCAGQISEVNKCPSFDCPLWSFRKGRIDKATKSVSMPEKGHIEAFSEAI